MVCNHSAVWCVLVSLAACATALPTDRLNPNQLPHEYCVPRGEKSAQCTPCSADKPIVIVGAGNAGLATAYFLRKGGCEHVIVLEAKGNIGGRMYSEVRKAKDPKTGKVTEYVVHHGANWVHGSDNNPIWDLNKKLSLFSLQWLPTSYLTVPTFGTHAHTVVGNKTFVPGDDMRHLFDSYTLNTEHFEAWLRGVEDGSYDIPDLPYTYFTAEFLTANNIKGDLEDDFMLFMGVYSTLMDGDDMFHVGLGNELSIARGLDKEWMVGWPGYAALNDYLAEGVDVRLNQQVVLIEWGENGSRVVTKQGETIEASRVVVTVSAAVMQRRKITFSPDLPPWKWHAYDDVGIALLEKIFFRWDEVWWPNVDAFWKAKPNERGMGKITASEWYNINNLKRGTPHDETMPPILLTTPAGYFAKILETMTDEDVEKTFMAELQSIFPNITIPKPVEMFRTAWCQDEFAYMSYASPQVDMDPLSFEYMAQNIGESLYFAGEATSSERFGYVDGSFTTGEREANKILHSCECESFDGSASRDNPLRPSNHESLRKIWARRARKTLEQRRAKLNKTKQSN